ncbi:MAG: glycosyl hydrolase [Breznakibacter sp.]
MIKLLITSAITSMMLYSCTSSRPQATPAQLLIEKLNQAKGKGVLFGHQDDLAYGVDWWMVPDSSDVKAVAGDYPAVMGWELGGLERGDERNLDSVSFADMRQLAIKAHKMGAINTFSWHAYSAVNGVNSWNTETRVVEHIIPGGSHHLQFVKQLDEVAGFFASLKDDQGNQIPVIFRPWHEMGGSWFWWGRKHCTTDDYKKLFVFTVDYLRKIKGLNNLVISYSPDGEFSTADGFLTFYPGDGYVDMLGFDDYDSNGAEEWPSNVSAKLRTVIALAGQKGKLAAFAETGNENLRDTTWFTRRLAKAIEPADIQSQLSYVLVWRNDPKVHFFFSHPNHASASDAKAFLDLPYVWLLSDLNTALSDKK